MKLIRRLLQVFIIGAVLVVLLSVGAAMISPSIAWRVRLFELKLTGRVPEIPLPWLLRWIRPDSAVNLYHLAEVPNVNASITNLFYTDGQSAAAGSRTFGRVCASCHGDDAHSRTGPNLIAAIVGMTDWKFFSTVKWGRPNTIMVAQPLSDREIWEVGAFLRKSALDAAVGKTDAGAGTVAYQPVSPAMLRDAGRDDECSPMPAIMRAIGMRARARSRATTCSACVWPGPRSCPQTADFRKIHRSLPAAGCLLPSRPRA